MDVGWMQGDAGWMQGDAGWMWGGCGGDVGGCVLQVGQTAKPFSHRPPYIKPSGVFLFYELHLTVGLVFTQRLRNFPLWFSYAKLKRKKTSIFPMLKYRKTYLVERNFAFCAER